MIKGRFLFLYHTDQCSSWDTARCPCARIFPFITAILTPLCALQPLFPVHKGRCKPRLVLGRPKLIIGDSAGSQLIAESCRNLWEELFQHTCQQRGCSHFSIPKTVIGYWAFFHSQKHEGLMCCQVEQSCSVHKGVWMSPSDGFRLLISDEHGWVQAHSCAYGHHWKAEAVLTSGQCSGFSHLTVVVCLPLSQSISSFFLVLALREETGKGSRYTLLCPVVLHPESSSLSHGFSCQILGRSWENLSQDFIFVIRWCFSPDLYGSLIVLCAVQMR